jgi:transposase
MAATLAGNWKCRGQADRGEHFAVGRTRGLAVALISKQSDLTLDEVVAAMRKRRIAGSRSAVWRFFKRHNISFKKKPAGGGAGASRRGPRTAALDARTGHV